MIERGRGNLLEAQTDALVNTVNTVGVMGKGIALQFKRAYPEMFAEYQRAAKAGELRTGRMHVWETHAVHGPRFVINFPTKEHWKGRSKLEYITSGLDDLLRVVTELGIRSVALPPLGCGNGGLAWSTVRPIIERAFADIPAKVVLFEPAGAPEASQMVERREPSPMTPCRALLLRSMERYREVALEEPSHLELQKLLYFLQLSGEPLKLRFTQHLYGPYADNLRHVLVRLEGHYIDGYGDGTDPVTQFTPIRLRPGLDYPAPDAESLARLDRTMELCAGFSTPFGMELLGSVHWIATHDEQVVDAASCAEHLWAWNERKRRLFNARHVQVAWDALAAAGWLATGTVGSAVGDVTQTNGAPSSKSASTMWAPTAPRPRPYSLSRHTGARFTRRTIESVHADHLP